MLKNIILLLLLFPAAVAAQSEFELNNASPNFHVRLRVEKCAERFCSGKMAVTLSRKRVIRPFQLIELPATEFMIEEATLAGAKLMYDLQSVVFFEDFNFDGREDLALRDGNNSGYGGPSYRIYLWNETAGRFLENPSFTSLAQDANLGMFTVDLKKKRLRTFSKSGCCWHQTREFAVLRNRPVLVFEETEDAMNGEKVTIVTRRLVGTRWQESVREERRGQ